MKQETNSMANEHRELMDYMDDMFLAFTTKGATDYQRQKISNIMQELERERWKIGNS